MTLVEVMVAAMVLFVVVWGTVAFLVSARTTVERAGQERTAAEIAADQLERARAAGYGALTNGTANVVLDGTSYTWTLTVATAQADPADGNSVYKSIDMSVDWLTSSGRPVVVRTSMSP